MQSIDLILHLAQNTHNFQAVFSDEVEGDDWNLYKEVRVPQTLTWLSVGPRRAEDHGLECDFWGSLRYSCYASVR